MSRDTGAIVTVVNTDDNPVPVLIAGMATQEDFEAHLNDTTDAHDASAISFDTTDSGLESINVQDAIDEHVLATTDVHGIADTGKLALTDAANAFTVAPQQITADDAAHKGLIIKAAASQSANLVELQNSSAAVLGRFNKGGYFVTALHSAPADGDLAAGELALWFDQTNGAGKLMIKAKTADGTVATGEVALT